jgi:hypothetical protein
MSRSTKVFLLARVQLVAQTSTTPHTHFSSEPLDTSHHPIHAVLTHHERKRRERNPGSSGRITVVRLIYEAQSIGVGCEMSVSVDDVRSHLHHPPQ